MQRYDFFLNYHFFKNERGDMGAKKEIQKAVERMFFTGPRIEERRSGDNVGGG